MTFAFRNVTLAAAAALTFSCATSQEATSPQVASATAKNASGAPQTPVISTRAKLLFEDASRSYEAQKKANVFDYPALERKFQAASDADPKLAEAEFNLGVLADRQGRTEDAAGHYQRALERKPSLTQAAENLGVIRENKGDVAGAMRIYEGIFTRYPQNASSRARLAEIFRKQNNQERAMELAKDALLRDPKLLLAYKVMIQSLMDQNQLPVAKLVTLKAIKVDENDPELYHLAGRILLEEKNPTQASLQFKKAIQVSSDYVPARIELAKLALKAENYLAARDHLMHVLQVNGKNAEAHLDLGVAYKLLGQYDKALQEYELAEKLDPNLAAAYLDHAILLHRHKDAPERALDLYKRYLSLVPEGALPADAPVLALEHEAEQLVQVKADAKRAEEEAKKRPATPNSPEPKKGDKTDAVAEVAKAGTESAQKPEKAKKVVHKAAVAGTSKDEGDVADEPKE